jgi:putative ABC transport system substrate-binding protein
MKRRDFIAGFGAVAALPFVVRAQQTGGMPVIGFLSSRSSDEAQVFVAKFREGLAELGYVPGRNVKIEHLWADGHYDRLSALAAEFVGRKVDVLLAAGGPPSALAAKAATSSIPIVFSGASDAIGIGLVPSLSRPGGNITGMSLFSVTLAGKRLELLRELIPSGNAFAYLTNPANPGSRLELSEAAKVAAALGVRLEVVKASTEQELKTAFSDLASMKVAGVIIAGEPFFDSRREMIVDLAASRAIPASHGWRENVVAGGLMSYGTSLTNSYREAGKYVGRILKGEKPADLPVMQPTKFELVINLKTAKVLGLTIPPTLLMNADEVIE